MTKLNAGSRTGHNLSSLIDSRLAGRERERIKEGERKVKRNAEAWIMEWVWCVYSQRSENYSHFAAFNQWLSLYILNPSPSLLPLLPLWQFSFHSEVICVAIRCNMTALHTYIHKRSRGNNTSSSKPDGWVSAPLKSLYTTLSPPSHRNLCPLRQDRLLCGLIILTWSILWLFVVFILTGSAS